MTEDEAVKGKVVETWLRSLLAMTVIYCLVANEQLLRDLSKRLV